MNDNWLCFTILHMCSCKKNGNCSYSYYIFENVSWIQSFIWLNRGKMLAIMDVLFCKMNWKWLSLYLGSWHFEAVHTDLSFKVRSHNASYYYYQNKTSVQTRNLHYTGLRQHHTTFVLVLDSFCNKMFDLAVNVSLMPL